MSAVTAAVTQFSAHSVRFGRTMVVGVSVQDQPDTRIRKYDVTMNVTVVVAVYRRHFGGKLFEPWT